jgi:cholesterol transport system auxiliary component
MMHWKVSVLGVVVVFATALFTVGCASRLPEQKIAVYDLGVPPVQSVMLADENRSPAQRVLLVPTVQSTRSLQQADLVYRLHYRDVLQPKSYARARWRSAPVELIDQRVRQQLGASWNVVHPNTQVQATSEVRILYVHIDEFSHVFESPQQSSAWLQARVTLTAPQHHGARLIGQRSFTIRQPSTSSDAPGGVLALRETVHMFSQELHAWLLQMAAAGSVP